MRLTRLRCVMSNLASLLLIAQFGAGCTPAGVEAAAPANEQRLTQAVHIYEVTVSYPVPIWYPSYIPGSPDVLSYSERFRDNKGPVFLLEEIPKGESFGRWTKLYAIRGIHRKDLSFDRHLDFALSGWVGACGRDNLQIIKLKEQPQFLRMLIVCRNTPQGNPEIGYGDGVGEVGILQIQQRGSTFVSLWHMWRGRSFASNDPVNWPAPKEELGEMLRRFDTVELIDVAAPPP